MITGLCSSQSDDCCSTASMDSLNTKEGAFDVTLISHDNTQSQNNSEDADHSYSQPTDKSVQNQQLSEGTENSLSLKFPPHVILTCCRLKTGQGMHVSGLAKKLEGGSEAIKMAIRRHSDAISFTLQGLEGLSDIYQCSFVQLDDAVASSNVAKGHQRHPVARACRKSKKLIKKRRRKGRQTMTAKQQTYVSRSSEKDEYNLVQSDVRFKQKYSEIDNSLMKDDTYVYVNDSKTIQGTNAAELPSEGSSVELDRLVEVESLALQNGMKNWKRKKKLSVHLESELYALNKAATLEMKGEPGDSDIKQECLICGEVFTQEHNLPRHIKHYHSVSLKEYKEFLRRSADERQEIIAAFWQMARLDNEHEFHKLESNMKCHFCGEWQTGTLIMRYHLKIKHFAETGLIEQFQNYQMRSNREQCVVNQGKHKYPCRYCGMMLAFICSRSRHENYYCMMNPAKKKLFSCSQCNKCFRSRREMQQHKSVHQMDDSKFVCDVCGKVRNTKSGLYQHKLKEHSGVAARFSCNTCQKTFFTKDKYQRHLTVHIDSRPFICELCGKTFKTKQAVTKHQRSVHHNQYPYRCNKCGHGVEKIQYLKSHRCGHVRRTQGDNTSNIPDNQDSSELAPCLNIPVSKSEISEQHFTCMYQTGRAAPQYLLSGAPAVINTQQMNYLELNQVAALPDNQQYMSQQNTSQSFALSLNIPLSQYSHVNYLQIPDTDRRQTITADMITNHINITTVNNNEATGYNKIATQVAPF